MEEDVVHWWHGMEDEDNLVTGVDKKSEKLERGKFEKKKMVSSPSRCLGRCFICGESGHWARDCKFEDLKNKCYHCRERGHIKRNCPKLFSQANKAEVEQIEEMEIDVIPVVKIEHDGASIGLDINCPCAEFGTPLVSLSSGAAETISLTIGLKRKMDSFNEERDSLLRNKKRRFEWLEYDGKDLSFVGSELLKATVKVEERVMYIDQEEGQEVWRLSPTQPAINTTPGDEGRAIDSSGAPYASHCSSHDADYETSIVSSPLPDMLAIIDLPNKEGNVDCAGQYAHDSSWHASGQDTVLGDWALMCSVESVAGHLLLVGTDYMVPMATTERCLVQTAER